MAGKPKDLVGQQFGRLEVVAKAGKYKSDRHAAWECACTCGKTITVPSNSLTMGRTKSCGCLFDEGTRDRSRMEAAWAAKRDSVKKYRFQGEVKTLQEWVVELGLSRSALIHRMKGPLKEHFTLVS